MRGGPRSHEPGLGSTLRSFVLGVGRNLKRCLFRRRDKPFCFLFERSCFKQDTAGFFIPNNEACFAFCSAVEGEGFTSE